MSVQLFISLLCMLFTTERSFKPFYGWRIQTIICNYLKPLKQNFIQLSFLYVIVFLLITYISDKCVKAKYLLNILYWLLLVWPGQMCNLKYTILEKKKCCELLCFRLYNALCGLAEQDATHKDSLAHLKWIVIEVVHPVLGHKTSSLTSYDTSHKLCKPGVINVRCIFCIHACHANLMKLRKLHT